MTKDLVKQIEAMSMEDLCLLNDLIVRCIRAQRAVDNAAAAMGFRIGDAVQFTHSRTGAVIAGTIQQRNRTTLTVRATDGIRWRVPAHMLTKGEG